MPVKTIGTLSQLWRYPVSSMGGEALSAVDCLSTGLERDRLFAVFERSGLETANPARKRWQGVTLAHARAWHDSVQISLDGERWHAPQATAVVEGLASLCETLVDVLPYGTEVDGRTADHRYQLAPLHLVSEQSLRMLEQLLPGSNVDVRRFRPNLVVDLAGPSSDSPPEYQLIGRTFRIGGVLLRGTRKTARCSFTTLAQAGLPEDREVLRKLISHFGKDFGIYCEVVEPGKLEQGMPIHVTVTPAQHTTVLVIGAGQAGASVARALRELGHRGAVTLFGDEAHAPYERPPLSKAVTPGSSEAIKPTSVLDPVSAEQLDIGMRLQSPVVRINRSARVIETADGRRHGYDHLIIATGGSARRLDNVSKGYRRVHCIRTLDDALALQHALGTARRVFIAGGGWLGLEVASALRAKHVQVTLYARQARLCARVLPAEVSDYLLASHREEGTDVRLGQMPVFTEHPDHVMAQSAEGAETADLLIVAIGITPNDWLARHAGLECREGVVVDADGATSDPAIYAIGDVALQVTRNDPTGTRQESWQNAVEQAKRAARSLMQLPPLPMAVPRFWSEQCGWSLQVAGRPLPGASLVDWDEEPTPLWRYPGFIVAIDRASDVHRFARGLQSISADHEALDSAQPDAPSEAAEVGCLLEGTHPPAPGQMTVVDVEQVGKVLIVNVDGSFHAIREQCPHADAPLSEGFLEGRRLVCPLHFAAFDLLDGSAHGAPAGCPRARTYKVDLSGGKLVLWRPASGPARG